MPGAGEVRVREADDGVVVVAVAGRPSVGLVARPDLRVGTELDHAEGHHRAREGVAFAAGADEGIDRAVGRPPRAARQRRCRRTAASSAASTRQPRGRAPSGARRLSWHRTFGSSAGAASAIVPQPRRRTAPLPPIARILVLLAAACCPWPRRQRRRRAPMRVMAARVREEFSHAWAGYRQYAWGHDALRPLSRTPRDWYAQSLLMTPVDALDTLILMGLKAGGRQRARAHRRAALVRCGHRGEALRDRDPPAGRAVVRLRTHRRCAAAGARAGSGHPAAAGV